MDVLYPHLEAYDRAATEEERRAVERRMFDSFSRVGAVLVTDMSGFSRITQARGIVHYMNMIRRMRIAMSRAVYEAGGEVIKYVGDNAFAVFPDVEGAIRAVSSAQERLSDEDRDSDADSKVLIGGGIDYGDYLAIASDDFFGDPVNIASKLGEDLATARELWLTERAHERLSETFLNEWNSSWQISKVTTSGVRLKTYQTKI